MKILLIDCIKSALKASQLEINDSIVIQVDRTKSKEHGDFATNIALVLAKMYQKNPFELAETIQANLPKHPFIKKTVVAKPGFINFYVAENSIHALLKSVLQQGDTFGQSNLGNNERVLIEFVSANPTGPLHVGHGRGAAYGASLANLLRVAGYAVETEYYVNDAGRQMDILAVSVWLRYLELNHITFSFPSNAYQGDYVRDIAEELMENHQQKWVDNSSVLLDKLSQMTAEDPEIAMDQLITYAKSTLGPETYAIIFNAGLQCILQDIKDDLQEFGVTFSQWFSEKSLMGQPLDAAIAYLKKTNNLYQKEGAWWFASTQFGDDKDRVVIRENGQPTYFASDIAYHYQKFMRGYAKLINIWGADHHGYIPRLKAVIQAFGKNADALIIRLVQFAILYRGEERLSMSTRGGSFVTLRELRNEVGNDAARYFYSMRKPDQHLDFDLELAKKHTKDNPVYYIQYAHARICSVFRNLAGVESAWRWEAIDDLSVLVLEQEKNLMDLIAKYPELIETAAKQLDPHIIAHYLQELAGEFHAYYNSHKVLIDDISTRDARLILLLAVRQVIKNGLRILGVAAPETM